MDRFRALNVCVIFSNYPNAAVSYDAPEPLRMIKDAQHLIYFDSLNNLKPFDVAYEYVRTYRKRLGTGDAYYINDAEVTKLKLVRSNPIV